MRPSQRQPDQLRPVRLTRGFTCHAEGSVLVEFGATRVLCTASVEEAVPGFLRGKGQGWVTAEYGMLPRATHTRSAREAAKGKQSGRTQEIQRLIGRSLRAVVDLVALPCLNMQFVINLGCLKYKLTPEEVLTAVTLNGAAAIDLADKVGSVEEGKLGDLVIWDAPDLDYICYRVGSNLAKTVIKRGEIV